MQLLTTIINRALTNLFVVAIARMTFFFIGVHNHESLGRKGIWHSLSHPFYNRALSIPFLWIVESLLHIRQHWTTNAGFAPHCSSLKDTSSTR